MYAVSVSGLGEGTRASGPQSTAELRAAEILRVF